jgi:hypothetical protein
MGSLSAAGLVGTPVRLHGILLGRPTDLLLDAAGRRVLGFVVESGDEAPRFLPFAASQPSKDVIAVGSALTLLDDVGFYRKRGVSFRSLVGTQIEQENVTVGTLIDMHVDSTGDISDLEVENDGLRHRVAAGSATLTSSAATAA